MKILILTPEIHFFSPVVLRDLFEASLSGKDECCVIATPKISSGKRSSSSLKKIISNTGWTYLFYMFLLKLKYDLYSILEKLRHKPRSERRFISPSEICRLYNASYYTVNNINSVEAIEIIRGESPDIILCVFFNQILKSEALGCAKKAALNLHPSYLPGYRGMSPILWMLAEGATEGGVTLHYMDEKIDTGRIIARKKFAIEPDDSFFRLYTRAARAGAEILKEFLAEEAFPEGEVQAGNSQFYGPLSGDEFKRICAVRSILRF